MEVDAQSTCLTHLRNISREDTDIEIANNVSTELTAFIDPDIWNFKKQLTMSDAGSLEHLRNISKEERDVEIANNVSTELTVSVNDIWEFKKKLTKSDVGTQTRCLIPKENLILKYLREEEIIMVEAIDHEGLNINVFDSDTKTVHPLCFKRWNSVKSYVFNGNWRDFVTRRELKEGDEIGLFWNPYASRLHFCVLA